MSNQLFCSVYGGGQGSIASQLICAIRTGNLGNLRDILSLQESDQQQGGNHGSAVLRTVTDRDIERALFDTASPMLEAVAQGRVEACRLLWARLSPISKQKYLDDSIDTRWFAYFGLLHTAAAAGGYRIEIARLFIEEFHFNVNKLNEKGETPLFVASNNNEIGGFLLSLTAENRAL